MRRYTIGLLLGVSVCLALGLGIFSQQSLFSASPAPSPTVGTPVVTPPRIHVNQATLLTVTSRIITDATHSVVPDSVKLESLDTDGHMLKNLGTMYDDGTHGDAVAGDGVFTLQVTLLESTPGTLRLQVAATFRAGPGRIASGVTLVPIVTNTPPVASAGPDQTVLVGATAHLDGSQSSDVDGDALHFQWTFTAVPAGSLAMLSDPLAVQPTFVVDTPGTYTVQLLVNDGTVNSNADTVVISTTNSRPVAKAGPDQTVYVGTTVSLDGSQSSDVDHDPLHYHWAITVLPAGSLATLSDPTASQTTVVVDRPGTYVVQLIVNDGTVDSLPATSTITAVADPQPPQLDLDPPDGAARNTATLLLTLTYQDTESGVDLTSVRMSLDGVDVTALLTVTATQATYQTTLPDGLHLLEASLHNRAGNPTQGTAQFSIDMVPPTPINPAAVTVAPPATGKSRCRGRRGVWNLTPGLRSPIPARARRS
jgi:hypothetical protein